VVFVHFEFLNLLSLPDAGDDNVTSLGCGSITEAAMDTETMAKESSSAEGLWTIASRSALIGICMAVVLAV